MIQMSVDRSRPYKWQLTKGVIIMKSKIIMIAVAVSFVMIALAGCGGDGGNPGGGGTNGGGGSGGPAPCRNTGGSQQGTIYGAPVTYGSETYETVVIGAQTWMARNLNYEVEGSRCYDDDPASCDIYGRLYHWETAMTVCPLGWHLPSHSEWITLTDYIGCEETAGTKLKATSGWEISGNAPAGTDIYSFAALPGGSYAVIGGYNIDPQFIYADKVGYWWSSTENGDENFSNYRFAYYRIIDEYWEDVRVGNFGKIGFDLFSVRCVKV
jgi:uncharacterized protein (TIGR02145 family)